MNTSRLIEDPDYINDLTKREREVLALVERGMTNPQIAAELVISRETVKTHVSRILGKLGARSRRELVRARLMASLGGV